MIDYTTMTHIPRDRKVTREQFEAECLALSGGTVEQLREYHEIVPCECGVDACPGWRAVYLLKNRRRVRSA